MTDQEKFFAFLEKHGCKEKWVKNAEEYHDSIINFLAGHYCEYWIDNAFTWDDTQEGENFWYKIDVLWLKEI